MSLAGSSCRSTPAPSEQGPLIASAADLNPNKLAFSKSVLTIGGTKVDARSESKYEGKTLTIDSFVAGEKMDSEIYRSDDQGVSLLTVTSETFDPPISIIKYGMHVGDTWSWSGKANAGGIVHAVSAKVTTASDNLFISNIAQHDVIRVDINLAYDSGTEKPALRKMQFWFVKDKGIVKRSFGGTLIRESLEE